MAMALRYIGHVAGLSAVADSDPEIRFSGRVQNALFYPFFPSSCLNLQEMNIAVSGFRRDVDEICALLGYYAASSGNPLPTFRDNVSVPSPSVKTSNFLTLGGGTSIKVYHCTLRNTAAECRSQDVNKYSSVVCKVLCVFK
jgi:hypothetical protein